MEPNKFSSEHIKNRFLTLTYENLSSEDCLDNKLQAKFYKSDQNFNQPEKQLIDVIEQQHQESKDIEEELVTLNSKTPCLSEAT